MNMTAQDRIKKLIKKSIVTLQQTKRLPRFKIPEILVSVPSVKAHGDYASNIAFQLAKIIGKKPKEIALIISNQLSIINNRIRLFEKVEVDGPGFINFWLSQEYLQRQIKEILKSGQDFGKLSLGRDKKIQVEFISANPTGPLTVANARGGPFGDCLANVLKMAGFQVEKAYYVNDYGKQILALGHSILKDKEAQYKGDYINQLAKNIKGKDPYRVGQQAAKLIVKVIKKTTRRLRIKYDEWIWESRLHRLGIVDQALKVLQKKHLLYEKDGALWFKSSRFGDIRDRVVVKKDGQKTYLAGDMGLHLYKFKIKKLDEVINIWGADHYGDVPGLLAAVEALGYKNKLKIVLLQFVTILEKGKAKRMSKRKGVFVTMDELLDEVGPDVVRFFFLEKSTNTHLNFDLDLAKEQSEKNPVYYVQYAYARIHSILAKSKVKSQKSKVNFKLLTHSSELSLIKQLIRFPEIVEDTAKDYQVQRLPQYALELASSFHQFYRDCQVLVDDKSLREARLGLILATQIVLKNLLSLMGISTPKRM